MTRRMFLPGFSYVLAVGAILSTAGSLDAQTHGTLVSGKVQDGTADWGGKAAYTFEAGSAGVLTVVVRSQEETDLFLLITDSDGQPLPNGRFDQDLGGDVGAEQFAITLPRAGRYLVGVETFGETSASFKIGVSWLPFPDLAVPADPDGSPSNAVPLRIGQDTREDSLDGPAGDFWDWFVLKADKAGTLTVATRAEEGDLILEAYNPGEFSEATERSDQDLQGTGGNEAITLLMEAGDEFFFKVSAFSEGITIPYRLQVGFIPN